MLQHNSNLHDRDDEIHMARIISSIDVLAVAASLADSAG